MPRHIRQVRFSRSQAVIRLQHRLEAESFPRIQMGLIVALTGGVGLLGSFLLLRAGVESMAVRYPLALASAYVAFLLLLWLWLRTKADDYVDAPDLVDLIPSPGSGSGCTPPSMTSGGGGDFGGGGASASFDGAADTPFLEPLSSVGDAAGSAMDADELVIPLVAIALAIGLAFASLYVVYLAPTLFAELLFDGALSYSLYRHLRATNSQHWLSTAFRRTALPFALTAVFLVAAGAAMAAYAPGARTLGEVIQHANT